MTSGNALEIVTEHEGSRSVVRLRGELDLSTENDVRREISAVLRSQNPQILLLDLSELAFTDSTGLGTMVWAHKQMTERGHQLWLAGPNPLVLRLLRITGLDKQLQLVTGDVTQGGAAEGPAARPAPVPEAASPPAARPAPVPEAASPPAAARPASPQAAPGTSP